MHARVTSVMIRPDAFTEAIRIYQDSIVSAIASHKGFHTADLIVDRSSGEGLSVTVWETEEDGKAYEASGTYQEQVAKLAQYFASKPTLRTYDVAVHAQVPARVSG